MKKLVCYIIIIVSISLASSCKSSNKEKAASADTLTNVGTNPAPTNVGTNPAPDTNSEKESKPESRAPGPGEGHDDILANIDNYLVSKIENGVLTVENKLTDATIVKAVAEVRGPGIGPDYYNLINIDPGGTKTTRVKSNTQGQICHIVKLNSTELTGGETILVGAHYSPK